jgi:small subunit ribosomal protein S21
MEVIVKEGKEAKEELQKALKQFSSMVKKSELFHELRRREFFLKPSKKRLVKRQEALKRRKRDKRKADRQKRYQ